MKTPDEVAKVINHGKADPVRASILVFMVLAPGLALMGLFAAMLFACLKRPHSGRLMSMVFAVAFSVFSPCRGTLWSLAQ
ncbi:hypothetical protein ISS98_07160 [Dyella flagellata]|uniref:Uncharacterized protein n=1 Tax=Dyella flagellata TaxID=1867833 RepID=A0ABQ5XC87_9GAMM|nr:hypothetical protein [Dyella flagellata]GLQ89062.1 hypothetical protein GCM10007898_26340 [Dyella flagellata]